MNERQNRILELLAGEEKRSVRELSGILRVSEVTIRQDLTFLENQGIIKRVHGAAILNNTDDLAVRLGINHPVKLKIAHKATEFVDDGETILIESGSVNALFARELVKHRKVTVLTTNIFIARQFRNLKQANIILLGGIYQHDSESVVGMLTKTCIGSLNFSKAFIGIDGFDETAGFTSRDMLRAEISSFIIEKCPLTFIVTDSSKFGKKELAPIGRPEEISYLVTDRGIGEKYRSHLTRCGVKVMIADE